YKRDHQKDPKVFVQAQWYPGNSDQLAIGQDEVLVTPLQLANAYASFANGGTLWNPRVAADAETPAGKVIANYAPKPIRTIALHPDWRAAMLAGFTGVVNNPQGTAFGVFGHTPLSPLGIAGKTGTAQVGAGRQNTSVFTSFAPAANPKYVVDAFVEQAGYGASVAAPVVRQIYDNLFKQPVQPITYTPTGGGGQN
ncbi:MAG: penicillin-binding transpeptidase domain-containing protein, partial [Acidimicrobiales bacterium]